MDYFAGKLSRLEFVASMTEPLSDHPEWSDRDARLKVMDDQGVEGAWMFPSQGVVLEPPMRARPRGDRRGRPGVQPVDRGEWGFAYQDRIFGVPFLTLSDPTRLSDELQWCVDHGARVVASATARP